MLLFIKSISFCLTRKSELPLPSSRRKPCISSATFCGISSTRRVAYHQHEVLYLALGFRLQRISLSLAVISRADIVCGTDADQHACIASICSEGTTPVKTQRTPHGVLCVLAGVAGFGPTNAGVKVLCLTAWLYPFEINIRIITQISGNVKSKSRKSVNFSFLSFFSKGSVLFQ